MHRFIPGVLLIQLISMVVLWINAEISLPLTGQLLAKILLPLVLMTIVAALWFDSIGRQRAAEAILKLQESHSRDREKLQIKTEKEKTKIIKDAHKEIKKESRRVSNKASLKVGLAFLAAAGAGLVMLVTELVTFGMMTLMTAGGALGGYLTRARQGRPSDPSLVGTEYPDQPRIINQHPESPREDKSIR